MSEYTLLIHCTFKTATVRNAIKTFMDRAESPVSEDEVDEKYKEAFLALEDVEWADVVTNMGKTGLSIFYEVLPQTDDYPEDMAQDMLKALHTAGGTKIYACFADDEEYQVYWGYDGDEIHTLYTAEDDEDMDEELADLDDDDEKLKLVSKTFKM